MMHVLAAAEKNTKNVMGKRNRVPPAPRVNRITVLLSIFSGALLTLSYPNFNLGFLGWIALIPLFFAVYSCEDAGQAKQAGFLSGLFFFGMSLFWMIHVHVLAWLFLVPIEAFFMMLFGFLVYEGRQIGSSLYRNIWFGLAWTFTEWLRAEFPIFGMGWNLLAYSQSDYLKVIQFAELFGAFGLTFAMALVNAFFFQLIREGRFRLGFGKWKMVLRGVLPFSVIRPLVIGAAAIAVIFGFVIGYGFLKLQHPLPEGKKVRISLIQGNIPQAIKWNPAAKAPILETYQKLSELASYDQPDLIVWPEAAFPGYFNWDGDAAQILSLAERISIPLIVGAPHLTDSRDAFNSAYLINQAGELVARYDKQNLVPFGEYVPLQPVLGFLNPIAQSMGISDFLSGKDSTVFRLANGSLAFSVLICFEDTFTNLARKFVEEGAEFLAVITNDAWFGATSAPYQHLQASIFRAVENNVPVVRAANTGISAFISPRGEVLDFVKDEKGMPIFVAGRLTLDIPLSPIKTFYRHAGWLFPFLAGFIFMLMFTFVKTGFIKRIRQS